MSLVKIDDSIRFKLFNIYSFFNQCYQYNRNLKYISFSGPDNIQLAPKNKSDVFSFEDFKDDFLESVLICVELSIPINKTNIKTLPILIITISDDFSSLVCSENYLPHWTKSDKGVLKDIVYDKLFNILENLVVDAPEKRKRFDSLEHYFRFVYTNLCEIEDIFKLGDIVENF